MANEVFVGRRDEQERFAALLLGLAASNGEQRRRWPVRRPSGDIEAVTAGSRVVLVHGLGGSGKSSLLRQFRAIAEGRLPGWPMVVGGVRTASLDWEDEAGQDPGRYAGVAGPSLVTVLDAVQRAVMGAFTGDGRAAGRVVEAFGDYRSGAARMPEYVARFRGVVAQAGRPGSAFTAEDAAALVRAAVSAGLVAGGHPGGVLGLGPDQVAETIQAGGHLSEAAAEAVTGRKRGEIPAQEYDLVTDPARELPRRVAAAIRGAADSKPLLVFLDTGEVIGDRGWGWLRRVMTRTGPQVVWVVGARFETEAEAGVDSPVARFVREIGDEHLMLMSPTRFDDAMIRAYLESRPAGRSFTTEQIDLIARFTRGLPLAVSFTATLLDGGQRVEEACRDIDDGHPSTVISRLARRYLVHAETREAQDAYPPDDPRRGDVTKILALALAYGNVRDDPDLLAALWDTSDPLATFQDLARRHDFVLPASRRLHDDVRGTLRTDLLDPYRRLRARPVNERALTLFTTRLASMRGRWPSLDKQVSQAEFTTALLGALWHTTWISNQDGLDLLTEILPILAVADPRTADAAAAITGQFADTYTPDQERHLDQLTQRRPSLFDIDDLPDDLRPRRGRTATRRVDITLDGLALHPPGSTGDEPPLGQSGDRTAAVHILRSRLQVAGHQDAAAVNSLQAVATDTTSARLRQAIGNQALEIADRLIWPALSERRCARTSVWPQLGSPPKCSPMAPVPGDPMVLHCAKPTGLRRRFSPTTGRSSWTLTTAMFTPTGETRCGIWVGLKMPWLLTTGRSSWTLTTVLLMPAGGAHWGALVGLKMPWLPTTGRSSWNLATVMLIPAGGTRCGVWAGSKMPWLPTTGRSSWNLTTVLLIPAGGTRCGVWAGSKTPWLPTTGRSSWTPKPPIHTTAGGSRCWIWAGSKTPWPPTSGRSSSTPITAMLTPTGGSR